MRVSVKLHYSADQLSVLFQNIRRTGGGLYEADASERQTSNGRLELIFVVAFIFILHVVASTR